MAIGWEKGFVVDKDTTKRKYVNCKDCNYCDKDDMSCNKNNLYIPDVGYDFWKQCKYFVIDVHADEHMKIQAFKKKGSSVLQRKKIDNPKIIYNVKTKDYHFRNLNEEYRKIFYSMLKNRNDSDIIKCYELLPHEVYDGYVEMLLSGDIEPFINAIALFMNNIEMVQLKKGIKKIVKKVMRPVGNYILCSENKLSRSKFEEMFLNAFCDYLNEKGAFDEVKVED